jgi:hypothetical protein
VTRRGRPRRNRKELYSSILAALFAEPTRSGRDIARDLEARDDDVRVFVTVVRPLVLRLAASGTDLSASGFVASALPPKIAEGPSLDAST